MATTKPRPKPTAAASVVDRLLASQEPAVRWKVRVGALGEDSASPGVRRLREEIRTSPRVRTLLDAAAGRGGDGNVPHVYAKWHGGHWALAALADLGYPAGDDALRLLAGRVLDAWLNETFFTEFDADTKGAAYRKLDGGSGGVPRMRGRYRRCGSQQGSALLSVTRLGLADERADRLVERLRHWQWPDGGWNCDKDPAADTSSFMETLLPMRGLAAHARRTGDKRAADAARRAAEVFLSRRLFRRRSDGRVIREEFVTLHYPLYWHYDILGGLKAMAELGLLGDPRCGEALDLLESKRLPDGGWPAEARHYKVSPTPTLGADAADWGGTSRRRLNEWVTADALTVLRAAGRM